MLVILINPFVLTSFLNNEPSDGKPEIDVFLKHPAISSNRVLFAKNPDGILPLHLVHPLNNKEHFLIF